MIGTLTFQKIHIRHWGLPVKGSFRCSSPRVNTRFLTRPPHIPYTYPHNLLSNDSQLMSVWGHPHPKIDSGRTLKARHTLRVTDHFSLVICSLQGVVRSSCKPAPLLQHLTDCELAIVHLFYRRCTHDGTFYLIEIPATPTCLRYHII